MDFIGSGSCFSESIKRGRRRVSQKSDSGRATSGFIAREGARRANSSGSRTAATEIKRPTVVGSVVEEDGSVDGEGSVGAEQGTTAAIVGGKGMGDVVKELAVLNAHAALVGGRGSEGNGTAPVGQVLHKLRVDHVGRGVIAGRWWDAGCDALVDGPTHAGSHRVVGENASALNAQDGRSSVDGSSRTASGPVGCEKAVGNENVVFDDDRSDGTAVASSHVVQEGASCDVGLVLQLVIVATIEAQGTTLARSSSVALKGDVVDVQEATLDKDSTSFVGEGGAVEEN